MPISRIRMNNPRKDSDEPLIDVEVDLTPQEMGQAYMLGQSVASRTKQAVVDLWTRTGMDRLIRFRVRPIDGDGGGDGDRDGDSG